MRCDRCGGDQVTKAGRDRTGRQQYRCRPCRHRFTDHTSSAFCGFRFPDDIIAVAVRWYLRLCLPYADVVVLLAERGVHVDRTTVFDWVQRFAPLYMEVARRKRRRVGGRWSVDELRHEVACLAVETPKGGLNRALCRPYPTETCRRSNPTVRELSGQCSRAPRSGGHPVRETRDCQHHGGRELGLMVRLTQVNRW